MPIDPSAFEPFGNLTDPARVGCAPAIRVLDIDWAFRRRRRHQGRCPWESR